MKLSMVTAPGETTTVEVDTPTPGPADVLVRVRACGICGSDALYISLGGLPGLEGRTPLGHEPAGEVVAVGSGVEGIPLGARVVINPMAARTGIIGSGGTTGGMAEFLLIEDAVLGRSLQIVPDHVPFEVAALNEPMAVARHAVNRTAPEPGDAVVVFGAGPIGLGAVLAYRALGAGHITVVDVIPSRLEKALMVGADAVVDSSREDVVERLIALQGEAPARRGQRKPATDVYLDAAGAPIVVRTILGAAKHGATVGIVAVHKTPVEVDFGAILGSELTLVLAMGYPTEIFEVTEDLVANWEKYAVIVSDVVDFAEVDQAFVTASTPGAADKVVVAFGPGPR
ncbi:zinc-binding dehydrogenase [Rathayibacter sp. VKM Ac-2803]|uniref:zinc-dependent alcohol dehydrogenase n=1 Tax=unclassified Rathayibacter TaxID=2609250 RepID=UPI001357B96C|nr:MULTISPECIES: zinc-binding dehydrogenase [unclassified Rathayibacter]MWV48702.1 zinc-binding dehydrogenase [Rathayibacter sp. VKM Ac-2803]MWV60308.1 zinc-binding dehydrogenase [Rathayibacter sp. VKM Ac-2754]